MLLAKDLHASVVRKAYKARKPIPNEVLADYPEITGSVRESFDEPTRHLKSDPGYLYHATNLDNLGDILDTGRLKVFPPYHGTDQTAWPDGATERRNYWSADASVVWQFAPVEGRAVILRARRDGQFSRESAGDWFSKKAVPIKKLEVLKDGKWVPLSMLESVATDSVREDAYDRAALKELMKDVRKHATPKQIKDAWAYKTRGVSGWNYEFHGPKDFFWHGQANSLDDAKVQGWTSWLNSIDAPGYGFDV